MAATSSPSYGYFGGGRVPPEVITITRFDFTSETTSDLSSAALPFFTRELSATSSTSYGYFGGGYTPGFPGSIINTITRLDFSNETVSNPGNNLPTARSRAATTQSNSYGYFGGGSAPPYTCTIARLDFSNENISLPGNNLPQAIGSLAGLSGGQSIFRGSKTYGYFAGGSPAVNTITRLEFSNETVSNPGKNLPTGRSSLAATSSSSYGYFGGGFTPSYINTISRLDFSNETVSDPGKNLPTARSALAATSSSSYGYFGGGESPNPTPPPTFIRLNTISRLDFSNETVSNPGKNLPTVRLSLAAT